LVPCFETKTIAELDVVREKAARGVKHAKSRTRQLESSQIAQVGIINITPTKDKHNIVDDGSSMTLTGRWNTSSTWQFSPLSCRNVK
jgi:hypothetical protein